MQDNQNEKITENKATPLAKKSKKQENAFLVLMGLGGILILFFMLRGCVSQDNVDKKMQEETATMVSANPPPSIATVSKNEAVPLQESQSLMVNEMHNRITQEQEEAQKLAQMRQLATSQAYSVDSDAVSSKNQNNGVLGSADSNAAFMNQLATQKTPVEQATKMLHPSTTLAQGGIILATLETRISSDLPGMVRAITSDDMYSEDGSQILVPRGSRLIGQYTNTVSQGQQRVFVVWQRLIRPDHIDIQLNSPGSDPLGGAGFVADTIDHHFMAQFGMAALLSVIGAGTANAGVNTHDQFNSAAAYKEALATSFNNTAKKTLDNQGVIPPTLTIHQGSKISVFIARDLDFYGELPGASE
ncbi:MAG: hypothetical protein LEGION0398_MBIBDBAK_00226 [Legionellaceae bacterium]